MGRYIEKIINGVTYLTGYIPDPGEVDEISGKVYNPETASDTDDDMENYINDLVDGSIESLKKSKQKSNEIF